MPLNFEDFFKFDLEAIPVHYRVSYPSWDWKQTPFRDQDHTAHFVVHAVKNDRDKIGTKYRDLPFGPGKSYVRIDRDNLNVARNWFAAWAASVVREAGIADPVFVPIPNRDGVVQAQDFKSAYLARQAAASFGAGAKAYCGLRFKTIVPKVQGVRQSTADLIANMTLVGDLPEGTIVIIDDVFTLGRHISAATKVLPRRPALVVVAGRTQKEPVEHPLTAETEGHYC